MSSIAGSSGGWRQVLLVCGVLAPLLYLATDRIAGTVFRGYDFSTQSISDLSASGSPVRTLVLLLTLAATALAVAFSLGVCQSGGILGRIVALLILGNALFGLVAMTFFPTQLGVRPAFATPGVILMFLSVLCSVVAMLFGATAYAGWMRVVSIGVPISYVLLALLRYVTAGSADAVNLIGTQERTMGYSYLVWMMILAVHLLLSTGALSRPANASY